ncbi:MAG TPA: ABC transporter substrate-binding protein [Myxococcales bacterium]|nr:ABC transporter substrate-binding protein [Myxococcales bacterium]
MRKLLVAAGVLAFGFSTATRAEAPPIRIGATLSETGVAAFLGDPEIKTLQLYVDKINAGGGIIGRKIQLVSYDDAGDPTKANTNVKRLIEEDKVDLIIGGTTTGATMAMIPPVEKAEIPFISLAGAVVIVEPVHKWVFKTPHTDRMAAEKVFEDMKKRGFARVGLLSENSAFGQSGRKETLAVAPRYGMTIVADEMYGPKDADVTTQLTKIRNTPGVQAIFVFGFGQGPSVVTRNHGQLGIKLPLYQSHGVGSEQYIQLSGKAAEGVRLPAAALLVARVLPDNDPQKAVVTSYANAYKEHYKADVSSFGGHAYDGLMLAVDAIKRAGSTDKAKVRDALEQTRGYMGTGGLVNMSPTDHMGLDLTAFRMLEVENGAWKLVK